ncbi:MAG: hypothetical protein DRO09_04055 [Thermoprotei archaeon]|nr:MAG: hypothetical protein DRO09_04055 [Thermoprotei archaeon]
MSDKKEEKVKEKEEAPKEEQQEQTPPIEELMKQIEKIKELEEQLKEIKADYEGLHSMYEEVIENLKSITEGKEEDIEIPSFEEWLQHVYEDLVEKLEEAKKKKKKKKKGAKLAVYYPYYPYPAPKEKVVVEVETKAPEKEEEPEAPKGEAAVKESEEASLREKSEKIAEMLRNNKPIKEQWMEPIVVGTHEIVGHARDFCRIVKLLSDKPGDTVNIPKVRDFDLGAWGTYGSPTLGDETGTDVISFTTATVQEAGVKFYMKRHLTEKADANVVELVNEVCRRAVLRAEDKKILSDIAGTTGVLSIDKSSASSDFDADWIAEIIAEFQGAGIDVEPNDLVLFISPEMHEALLKDIAGSLGLVFARPDVVQKGLITQFMGVTIRVVSKGTLPQSGSNYCAIAFKKNGYVFCPKRNFLVEADPDPANRRTLIVVTTAAAGALVNPKYGCKVITPVT